MKVCPFKHVEKALLTTVVTSDLPEGERKRLKDLQELARTHNEYHSIPEEQ